ncbi:hypothetical protein [Arundinibacter roseus]|uniref:hypothetical protein n=1 Tax=Arundinibacter roseus TaxID=2070510 RepID=UPI001E306A28|nr:hypothetical protein [Arundinibacter roseus]
METEKQQDGAEASRRQFMKTSVGLMASVPWLTQASFPGSSDFSLQTPVAMTLPESPKSIAGLYGPWAAGLRADPPMLSLRAMPRKKLTSWKKQAVAKVKELVASPPMGNTPAVTVLKKYIYDGLEIEELSWQLPYGRPTQALLLKPQGVQEALPGILALHDHSGEKYYGYQKITRTTDAQDLHMREHQAG